MEDASRTTALAAGIEELVERCEALQREVEALRQAQNAWRAERAKLIERNELAKSKIDAMIGRLKSLDEEAPGRTARSSTDFDRNDRRAGSQPEAQA